MSRVDDAPLTRKRLRTVLEELANDRKLDIIDYAATHGEFSVAELTDELDLPHTTAHEYCRDLQRAGLLSREQGKPARYSPIDFEVSLSPAVISDAVENEARTLEYAVDRYGEGIVDDVIDVWERVEAGELTQREASARVGIDHADFLRVAAELELPG